MPHTAVQFLQAEHTEIGVKSFFRPDSINPHWDLITGELRVNRREPSWCSEATLQDGNPYSEARGAIAVKAQSLETD